MRPDLTRRTDLPSLQFSQSHTEPRVVVRYIKMMPVGTSSFTEHECLAAGKEGPEVRVGVVVGGPGP